MYMSIMREWERERERKKDKMEEQRTEEMDTYEVMASWFLPIKYLGILNGLFYCVLCNVMWWLVIVCDSKFD